MRAGDIIGHQWDIERKAESRKQKAEIPRNCVHPWFFSPFLRFPLSCLKCWRAKEAA